MSNNKIDFINDLLASEKLSINEKKKILDLTKNELKNFDSENSEIKKRIDSIEVKIKKLEGETINIPEGVIINEPVNNLPEYKSPKYLKDFLLEYNQDPILKYTCHTIDNPNSLQNILDECKIESYDFQQHLNSIQKKYNNLTYKYKGKILTNITSLIGVYLGTYTSRKVWSEENIEIKWISPELIQWAIDNPGKFPNPLEEFQREKFGFQSINLNNGNTLTNFSELVIFFKNLFHFKSSNKLKTKIEEIIFLNFNDNNEYKFLFDSNFFEDIEIFTYSDSLMQAFVGVIKMSKKQFPNEKLDVKLFLNYDEQSLKEFKIVILNSIKFKKHVSALMPVDKIEQIGRYGDDFTDLIKKQLNGLCNFYIQAEFEDQQSIGIVNIWDGLPLEFKKTNKNIEGVEFILKMY